MVNHERYASIKNIFRRDPYTHKVAMEDYTLPEFRYLRDRVWVWTEKLDGTNVRVILDDPVDFRGRSDRAEMPKPLVEHLKDRLGTYAGNEELCLYGEGIGSGIQKGNRYGSAQSFILFDVRDEYGWMSRKDAEGVARHLNIPIVPVVRVCTIQEAVKLVQGGLVSTFGDFYAEGLVGKPYLDLYSRHGERLITKIKHRDFYQKGSV